uniref:Uncharacterized protein n=1 Tax=Arundo donax TaxID=35708 RepID=A0A0A8YBJ2_ARUDO
MAVKTVLEGASVVVAARPTPPLILSSSSSLSSPTRWLSWDKVLAAGALWLVAATTRPLPTAGRSRSSDPCCRGVPPRRRNGYSARSDPPPARLGRIRPTCSSLFSFAFFLDCV